MGSSRRVSRRRAITGATAAASIAVVGHRIRPASAQDATPVTTEADGLPDSITRIIKAPRYAFSRWGLHVADRETGEVLLDYFGGFRYLAASTTKLFPGAAALAAYGPDYRFETPVYRTGPIESGGVLNGDLVLVASGDMTMGGRTTPEGTIDFVSPIDHINAVALPGATLTPENPLAGLDELANQVAAAGISRVEGDVIIDDRLFAPIAKDNYILTPIWINDNLIDITITPGAATGAPATMVWRPETATYQLVNTVTTSATGDPLSLTVEAAKPGTITIAGTIPLGSEPAVKVYQVEDPSAFARTLFIEALARAGVAVAASPVGRNADGALPAKDSYRQADRVALFTSPPFSENIKLIFKVSHNQHADMLIFLLALKAGEDTFDAGMAQIPPYLEQIGIDPLNYSLSDGRGNEYTDLFSPVAVSQFLSKMATQSDFASFFAALPMLGVDGAEIDVVPHTSPVAGKASAKSGTTVAGDVMNQRPLLMTRGLAGYLTTKSGRETVFGVYVNDVPLQELDDVFAIISEHGSVIEAIYELF